MIATDSIRIAKERVGILDVCRLIGMPEAWAGAKLTCPFGEVTHSDGGFEKSFRVYDHTNSCYCFACGKAWNPVTLYAEATDTSLSDAADALLEKFGFQPEDVDAKWTRLVSQGPPEVSHADLTAALQAFLTRSDPMWEVRQFDTDVATQFQKCLDLLPSVRTDADAAKWLDVTKQYMIKKLGEAT